MSRNSGKEETPVVIRSNYSRKGGQMGSKFSGGPRDGRKNTSRGWTAYGKGYVKGVFHTEKGRRVIAVAGSGTRHTTIQSDAWAGEGEAATAEVRGESCERAITINLSIRVNWGTDQIVKFSFFSALKRRALHPFAYKNAQVRLSFVRSTFITSLQGAPYLCMYSNQLGSTHNPHRGFKHTAAPSLPSH